LQAYPDTQLRVLKLLLRDSVEASLKRGSPKLLLRRTETVVEKMLTTWLTLGMYQHLQSHVARPLYNLFKVGRASHCLP
jgi:plexin A